VNVPKDLGEDVGSFCAHATLTASGWPLMLGGTKDANLPAPKSWLILAHSVRIGRLLHADRNKSFVEIAEFLGYPDQYVLSRALSKSLGWGFRDLRGCHASNAIIEHWWSTWNSRRALIFNDQRPTGV
jgi:hypothetical protein